MARGHTASTICLRLSVTGRCDLRYAYCMPERMEFLPRSEILSLGELDRLASIFNGMGIRKLRLTGGEPLVRKGFVGLVESLSRHLGSGLDELVITTNGTRLAEHAAGLARHGVKRINVSIDSLDPATYARITRGGDVARAMNRVRVTCTGQLYPCLGDAGRVDLRDLLRSGDRQALEAAMAGAIRKKPLAHDFLIAPSATRGVARHMSVTGG